MRRWLYYLALVFLTPACVGAEDANYIRARNGTSKRINGVQLKLDQARVKAGKLTVRWILDYDGDRKKVSILAPTLSNATFSQSHFIVYAWSNKGRHELNLYSPSLAGKYWAPADWFVHMTPSKPATGQIDIDLKWSEFKPAFSKGKPPEKIWLQLMHKPWDRGEAHSLDAWTGQVTSPMLKVPLAAGQ